MTGFGVTLGSLELGLGDSVWWIVALVVLMTAYGSLASAAVGRTRRPGGTAPAQVPSLLWTGAPSWVVVTAICLASCVVWFPAAGLAGGLPAVGAGLGTTQSELQWIADIYPLVLTALLLPAGTLLDRYGRRRGMLIGLTVLGGALMWCAYASSPESMMAARFVSAVASALIFPATLATLTSALPERLRDRAVAIWAGTITIGSGFGLMGALGLLEAFWWGSMFVGMAVATVVGLLLVAFTVPETKADEIKRFDGLGAVLGVLGPGGLVLGLTEGPIHGWHDPLTLGALLVGTVALTAFIAWEFRCPYPMLDARVFLDRRVLGSSIALIVIFTIDFAMFFLFFQFRGYGFGEAPFTTAWLLMTAAGAFVPSTLIGPAIADRWGMRFLAATMLSLCAGGIAAVSFVDRDAPTWLLVLGLVLFWFGVGGFMTPATQGILRSLPAADQGVASAVNDIVREFGAALGIALFGSLFYAGYRSGVADLADASPALADGIRSSPGAALAMTNDPAQVEAIRDGVIEGWQFSLWVGVGILVGGMLLICACLPKHVRRTATEPVEVELALEPVPQSVLT